MSKKKICGIYKITNLVNGKCYIGQAVDIHHRWKEHMRKINDLSYDYVLYRAFRKYGVEQFSFEIIEECGQELLDERERYYIEIYHSYVSDEKAHGYNMTLGGDGQFGCGREVDQYSLEGEYLATYHTITEASNATETQGGGIGQCCKKERNMAGGFMWGYHGDEPPEPYKDTRFIAVAQYDLQGNYMATFDSVTIAAAAVKGEKTAITSCCKRRIRSCYGYQWRYAEDDPPNKYHKFDSRPVYQYSLSGEYIRDFPSCEEASIITNTPKYMIYSCCKQDNSRAGEHMWKYEKYSHIPAYIEINNKVKIIQLTLDNEFVAEYDSVADAARSLNKMGKANGGIVECCKDRRKQCNGFKWKYKT